MLYSISKASKAYGADEIFNDVTFEIKGTEKIAIVGRNGCGKTTFLRCMCGEESFDHANIARQNGTEIGYLSQKVLAHDDWTVEQELMTIYEPIFALQKKMNELEDKMAQDYSEKVMNQYGEAQEKFEAMNGYHWESEMKTVFTRFGFPIEQLSKKIGEFSGGQKTRIAFVKLLLSKPDILLLDEPTNHLDIPGKEALEEALKGFTGTILFVSHDRYFIQQLATGLLKFENGSAEFIEKSWNEYEENEVAKASMVMATEKKASEEENKAQETRRQLSPEAIKREIKKLEEQITDKEAELEDLRDLRYEPEYYQDYQKMNALDQDIDDVHNELAHLYKQWEELSEEA